MLYAAGAGVISQLPKKSRKTMGVIMVEFAAFGLPVLETEDCNFGMAHVKIRSIDSTNQSKPPRETQPSPNVDVLY